MNKPDFIVPPEREFQENDLKTIAETRAEQLNIEHRRHAVWLRFVTVLAAIVVFCTTYALIIPAITWEKTLICEFEEHVHSDICYEDGVLICGKEVHIHTDACFDAPPAKQTVFCGHVEHVHGPDCYFEDGTLKCTMTEHTHTEDCAGKITVLEREIRRFAAPGDPINHVEDPSTKNLIDLFKIGGNFSKLNDGKVAVDKTVEWNSDADTFSVTLSALGQSFNSSVSSSEQLHPDVVFVVDTSSSMVTNAMEGTSDSRLALVVDALNLAFTKLLEADPETRIGLVTYNTQANTDGNLKLSLAQYDKLPAGSGNYSTLTMSDGTTQSVGQYFKINNRGTVSRNQAGTIHISYDDDFKRTNDGYLNGSGTLYETPGTGTYTQDGLMAGLDLFTAQTDKDNREPVLILISDGEPGIHSKSEDTSVAVDDDDINEFKAVAGYWTIKTAAYVKRLIRAQYETANPDDPGDLLFYSIGPGITSQYGKTVLSPGGASDVVNGSGVRLSNIEVCAEFDNSGADNSEIDLYNLLANDSAYSSGAFSYCDFADWSMCGEMTPTELIEGMQTIINSVKQIPRPIITTTSTTVAENIIDTDSFFSFTDTLGTDMDIVGAPVLYYGNQAYASSSHSTGTITAGTYKDCNYTLYKFFGSVIEESTHKAVNLDGVRAYVIERTKGSPIIEWQFPADLLPIIYHDTGLTDSDADDVFNPVEPIRLVFDVINSGVLLPGVTYQTNSTNDVTTCKFTVAPDNPYDGYVEEVDKTQNKTDTEPYVRNVILTDDKAKAYLGNNGILQKNTYDVIVEKEWVGGTPPSSLMVYLLQNGLTYGTATLSSSNSWKYTFKDVPAFDTYGNPYVYTVKENAISGYYLDSITQSTGTNIEHIKTHEKKTYDAYWQEVAPNSLISGKTYRLLFDDSSGAQKALGVSSSTETKLTSLSPGDNDNQKWILTRSGVTWSIQNVLNERYLRNNSGFKADATDEQNNLTIRPDGRIRAGSSGSYRYLAYGKSNNVSSALGDGTQFKIEMYVEARTVEEQWGDVEIAYTKFHIVNKPLPDDLPVEKVWGIGTTGKEKTVTLSLFEKDGTTVTKYGSDITLSSSNDWKTTIDLSGCDTDKKYYIAEADTGDFIISYPGGGAEYITYDGDTFKAMQIVFGKTVKITVRNDAFMALPSTGGSGVTIFYASGALLNLGALMTGLLLRRKRERRTGS